MNCVVYVSTIQRIARNLFGAEGWFAQWDGDTEHEDDADNLDIPVHAFDLVIADECHRGYTAHETSVWRDTLYHFDAIRLGLTATPAAHTAAFYPLQLRLHVSRTDPELQMEVSNSGHWIEADKNRASGGVGLENLQRRLVLLYPGQHRMEITRKEDSVSVWICIPSK